MKKIFIIGIALVVSLFTTSSVSAQGVRDVRINEILVINHGNLEDDYGHREGWIELFNAGYSSMDVGGCYLTIYKDGEGSKYLIPKGDPRTRIAPQGYLVFFAEGTATKGIFHTNFTLDKTGYLALYDQSGKGGPVSEVTYNVEDQAPDISIGYFTQPDGTVVFKKLSTTTPNATNELTDEIPNHEKFRLADPYGVTMAVTAMTVVFSALILLYLIFRTMGKFNIRLARKKKEKGKMGTVAANDVSTGISAGVSGDITGEELAAIAMALHQYENDLHDIESSVLTINKVARAYSPWSSKIYGLRQMPERKK